MATIKANGRSALILAAGLLVCFAGPSRAASSDSTAASSKSEDTVGEAVAPNKVGKHGSRHSKSSAHPKSGKDALKSSDAKKSAGDSNNSSASSALPPSVANANAQLASADTTTGNAKAMSARASQILQAAQDNPANARPAAESQVVSADQLNDVDRALHESAPPASAAPTLAMAVAEAPASPATSTPVATNSAENSTWDRTSLIGKIFIGFGALLTMASAARMFMA